MEYCRNRILHKLAAFAVCMIVLLMGAGMTVYGASWETEDNDSTATADVIPLNTAVSGNIRDYEDDDYYKFTTLQNGVATVKFDHNFVASESTYWDVWLMDSNKKILDGMSVRGDKTSVQLTPVGLPAGTYYILVEDDYDSTVTYTVTAGWNASSNWETEWNTTRPTADVIALNSACYGTIRDYEDDDYYKFETTQNGIVTVRFSHDYVASERSYWYVELQDVDGTVIDSMAVRGDRVDTQLTPVGLPAGTYYIKVEDEYDSTVTYNVTAAWEASGVWETEWNDTRPTADVIPINTSFSGNIRSYDDEDFYKFTTTQQGVVNVKFTHEGVASENNFWYVELQDVNGGCLTYTEVAGDEKEISLTAMGLPAGTYYIAVEDEYDSTVTYTVNAQFTACHAEQVIPAVAPTCTMTGLTEGKICVACNEILAEQQVVPMLAHVPGAAATCTTAQTCLECGVVLAPATGHTPVANITPAKAGKNGTVVTACYCGYVYTTETIPAIKAIKLDQTKFYYNGSKKHTGVTVTDANGYYLIEGTDYTVKAPAGRKNVGKYTYKIVFQGKYAGTKTRTITINPKAPAIKKPKALKRAVTVKWGKVSKQADGYQVWIATNKKFTKGKKQFTVKKAKTTSKKISKLKAKKNYYVKVRTFKKVKGKTYYSKWSTVKAVKTK